MEVPAITGTIVMLVVYGGVLAIGLAVIFRSGRDLQLLAGGPWRETGGRVVYSQPEVAVSYVRPWYRPKIEYEYSVSGKTYRCDRLTFARLYYRYAEAERVAGEYPVGSEVTVHYHAERHGEAFLQRGGGFSLVSELTIGFLGTLFGALSLFTSFV